VHNLNIAGRVLVFASVKIGETKKKILVSCTFLLNCKLLKDENPQQTITKPPVN
jgi:hypothetical protein